MVTRDKNEAHPGIITVVLAGLFLGGGVNVFLAFRTFITIDELFAVFLCSGAVMLAGYYILVRSNRRYFLEIAGLSFIGWASLITALFMLLNYIFHTGEKTTIYAANMGRIPPARAILSQDRSYEDFPYLLYFEELENNEGRLIKEISITTAKGLFGYRIVLNRNIVYQ